MERLLIEDRTYGALAQLGERGLCKPEVRGSIPLCSTKFSKAVRMNGLFYVGDVMTLRRALMAA